ncbi:uncharacterized protein BYT42DRAFT_500773, partial [Radiomyces spectabilis]|uniref:uncharacterized protein n=1 Tax=Radiomyces spectabilis TaxID=64574 RepID=UPI002220C746
INKKRRRAAPSYGVATPSEVFHRNLVDAVSNVEDSDDNECYVYPYSSSTNTEAPSFYYDQIHRTPSSSLYRPQSLRSHPLTPSHEGSSRPHITGFLTDFFRPALMMSSTSKGHDDEHDENECNENYRPKLRTYVMDHPQRSKNSDPSHASFRHGSKEMERCYDGKPRRNPYMGYTDGYTSDDEGAPLLRASRTGSRYRSTCSRVFRNLSLSALAICMLLFVIVAYRAKPLMDVSVEVGRVLASDKELIFDLRVKASNWNWWTLRVADADISVFAFSQVVPLEDTFNTTRVDPAEYLGGCVHFDEPLSFASSVFHSRIVSATTQIRIKSPGADKSGNERWSRIIRYPYGLLARGVLRYRSLPVVGLYPQTVAICDVANVEPNTGRVSEDPDQAYCLNYR